MNVNIVGIVATMFLIFVLGCIAGLSCTQIQTEALETTKYMKDGAVYQHYSCIQFRGRFYLTSKNELGEMRLYVTDTRPTSNFTRYKLAPEQELQPGVFMYSKEAHLPILETTKESKELATK